MNRLRSEPIVSVFVTSTDRTAVPKQNTVDGEGLAFAVVVRVDAVVRVGSAAAGVMAAVDGNGISTASRYLRNTVAEQ